MDQPPNYNNAVVDKQPYPPQQQQQANYPPPQQQQQGFIAQQPGPLASDNLFMDKLRHIQHFRVTQQRGALETITGGIVANRYVIGDSDRPTPVEGGKPGQTVPTPVFIVEEESDCCARCWCPGNQPLLAKFYHAIPTVSKGSTACGIYLGHDYKPDPNLPVAMTMERDGCHCCSRWICCYACADCCLDRAYYYTGDRSMKPGDTQPGDAGYFGKTSMPLYGGGCTPTLHMAARQPNQSGEYEASDDAPFGKAEGPTCYGGWMAICWPTFFEFSFFNSGKRESDIGHLEKRKPEGCAQICLEMCSSVDDYDVRFNEADFGKLTPEQKAVAMATAIHVDIKFFENDEKPITARDTGNGGAIRCTFCNIYCLGVAHPCYIELQGNGDSG